MKKLFLIVALVGTALCAKALTPVTVDFLNSDVRAYMATNTAGVTNLDSLQWFPGNVTNAFNTVWTNGQGTKIFVVATNNFVANTAPTGCYATTNSTFNLLKTVQMWPDWCGNQLYSTAPPANSTNSLAILSVDVGYIAQSNTVQLVFVSCPDGVSEDTDPNHAWVCVVTNGYTSTAAKGYMTQTAQVPYWRFGPTKAIRLQSITAANAGAANNFPIYRIRMSGWQQ